MELRNLINKMSSQDIQLDPYEIRIENVLEENKYNKLLNYLLENKIKNTNDLKKMTLSDYNKLKMGIPDIEQVGEEKTENFIKKLDSIRNLDNTSYQKDVQLELIHDDEQRNDNVEVKNVGKIHTSKNWFIEINFIKYDNSNEYLDIRQVKKDGTRAKGISIKKEFVSEFKDIINQITDNNIDSNYPASNINLQEEKDNNTILDKNDNLIVEYLEDNNNDNKNSALKTSDNLKTLLLNNEKLLYDRFSDVYGQNIQLFIKKIEALPFDGDIVKFLNNPSILDIKKEQYDLIHENGMKTAIDIMNDYDKSNLQYTTISDMKIGEKINTMTLCAVANNFNLMLGMYYNKEDDYIILKSQTSGGEYDNKWIDDKRMLYYLQTEKDENYPSLEFSHLPNQICRDILLNINDHTKIYLFDRDAKKEDYCFQGEFKPVGFLNKNRCIVLERI